MSIPTIKFSHIYNKMRLSDDTIVPRTALLMEVFVAVSEELHPRLVEWDTAHFDNALNNWAYYKLPKGKVLVLLLKTHDMIWTTIRRYTPAKHKYYLNKRWSDFNILIDDLQGGTDD